MLAILTAIGGSAGCGYTLKSQYPDDVKTVAVPIFQRAERVYRRDIEFDLTEAVVKRIEQDTPYKVVDRSRADTELRGAIERVDQHIGSFDPDTGVPRDLMLTITVSYVWEDLRPGRPPVRSRNPRLTVTTDYIIHGPVNEDFFVGNQDVVNRLAQRIVEGMEADW
jgi:outer membrane lipopolysaccharide assembly protein LptE/RlpB